MATAVVTSVAQVYGAFLTTAIVWWIPFLYSLVYVVNYDHLDPEGRPKDAKKIYERYDFIIIGAGSAGSVLANRLSEIPDWNILLLEAGGDETFVSDIPGLAAVLQGTRLDWKYKTEPLATACLAFKNGRCSWPRGKVLGGSSVLNYMLYVRGNRLDYDQWESLGNPGWSWDDVFPYFLKSEDNRNPYLARTPYHNTGGYLTVQEPPYRTPLSTAFVEAGIEMGYENRDCNGPVQTGFMIAQGTLRRGSRCSTSKAFLRPIRHRPNLHIAMHSHVHRILIDPDSLQAYGVRFKRRGKMHTVLADKEVLLSAGAISSPQILMLSGLGPAEHLNQLGIPVVANLSGIGTNLQDHIATGGLVFLIDKPYSLIQHRFENLPSIFQYIFNQRGPLTLMGGIEGLSWVNSKYQNASQDWPDVQFHFGSGSPAGDGGSLRQAHGLSDRVWYEFFKPIENLDSFTLWPTLLRPRSTGYIRLRSANPYDHPLIYPNYLTDKQDIRVLVEGAKIALALGQTKSFRRLGAKFYDKKFPGCENLPHFTNEYWTCFVQQYTATFYHSVGTCKMGPASDPWAVVDAQLRVHGIQRLRVIDTSIMPKIVNGNTNAPTIMIGEKAADVIKEAYGH